MTWMLPAHSAHCSPCWQARHSVRTPPSFSWRRADAVIRWSLGWPPPDTRHTILMSESASVTCCSSISRAGLMISRCRLYLLATFSRAVSNTTCSKSWKYYPWTDIGRYHSIRATCVVKFWFFGKNHSGPFIYHLVPFKLPKNVQRCPFQGLLVLKYFFQKISNFTNYALTPAF